MILSLAIVNAVVIFILYYIKSELKHRIEKHCVIYTGSPHSIRISSLQSI